MGDEKRRAVTPARGSFFLAFFIALLNTSPKRV
jgi:hypothetical protein